MKIKFENYIRKIQFGAPTDEETISDIMNYYKSSDYVSRNSIDYTEFLENQINLLYTFFNLTESLR